MRKLLLKIFSFKYGDIENSVGLLPLPKDDRDLGFSLRSIFGGDYKPKHAKKILPLLFPAKHQRNNTCQWVATVGAKENIDEKVELDERMFVMLGRKHGMISGDGFSNLRSGEMLLKDYGVSEKGIMKAPDNGSWEQYSDPKYLTTAVMENASKHKSKSFLWINDVSEIYRAIDDGHAVKIGTDWRTSMNMSGGFSFPWLLNFLKGMLVGAHATYIFGYDLNYRLEGTKAFKVRNSYSNSYGDDGCFWIEEEDLPTQIKRYGAVVNYDLDRDVFEWLKTHQGVVVKSDKSPDVFLIQGDKKRKYDDLASLYAHGKNEQDIVDVDAEILNNVKEGKNIDFWSGGNVKAIKSMIQQKSNLKPLFKQYFNELL